MIENSPDIAPDGSEHARSEHNRMLALTMRIVAAHIGKNAGLDPGICRTGRTHRPLPTSSRQSGRG